MATLVASFRTLSSVPIGRALLGLGGRVGWVAVILFSRLLYLVSLILYVSTRVSATGWKLWVKF